MAGSIGYSACHPVRRDSSTATTALFPDFASKTIRSAAGHSDSRMALMRPIIKTNDGCDVPKASGLGAVKWTLRSGWHHLDPVRPVPRLRATRSHRRHSHRPTRSDHRRTSPAAIPIEPAAPPQLTVPRVPSLNASGSPPLARVKVIDRAGIRNPQHELPSPDVAPSTSALSDCRHVRRVSGGSL